MTCYYTTFPTDLGLFSLGVNEEGKVLATAFGDLAALQARLLRRGAAAAALVREDARLTGAREQVLAYLSGHQHRFTLPVAPQGSAFQQRVWRELGRIPFGSTISYGELARRVGSAPRAVGRANATNPICLIIPCHRVIGADGTLTGFAFGEDTKRRLLELEGAEVAA